MKPAALASQHVFWECHGYAFWGRPNTLPPLPFQFMYLDIGPFYRRFSHRLLSYLLMAACLMGGVLLALGITGGADFFFGRLPLACTLALYLAVLFTFSHVVSDFSANRLWPRRMSYGSRNVGKQCAVLLGGLALGFWVHGRVFPDLMQMCAQSSASQLPISPSLVPMLCAVLYACVFMVPMSQHGAERNTAARPEVLPLPAPPALDIAGIPQPPPVRLAPATTIDFRVDGRRAAIPIKAISHISAEDNYCRVVYQSGRELKELLVREALKGLAGRLRSDDFVRIHRSHLVNKKQVTAYKRKGRKHWLLLGSSGAPLPISRRRQAQVKEALADAF